MSTNEQTVGQVIAFHGHMCPGLALGIRAAEVALAEVGAHSGDEEVVAIVETDMCAVDAVQFLTGCTFGKGNLIHRDYGKNAYTFLRRSDGHAVRISTHRDTLGHLDSAGLELFTKVKAGLASAEERQLFTERQAERSSRILDAPLGELYDIQKVAVAPPAMSRVLASVACSACEEPTMETRLRRLHDERLCVPCFEVRVTGAATAPSARQQIAQAGPATCACSTEATPAE